MDPVSGTSIGLVMMAWAGLAGAAAPTTPAPERGYSLQYQAAAGCPDAATLTKAIESRTPGAVQAPSDLAAVRLRVELREDGTSTLWVGLPEGNSRREFPEAACADAVASIAVIASMLLEADASERAATTQSVMDYVDPTAPVIAPAAPTTTQENAPVPATPAPPTSAPARRRSAARQATPAPNTARLRFALSAGALLESAVASGAPLGANAGFTAWLEPQRRSLWLPSIRAEVLATLPATVQAAQGDVKLSLVAARLHLCPLSLPVSASLRLVPCLSGDAGNLHARGAGRTANPQATGMLWLALGGTLRAQLALGQLVSVESWLGLRGLARADNFVFHPNIPAYQVPPWSLGAGLGLGVALP
ncbi:MAG TPA: hypothetical protein VNG33_16845 [Polyangiaceae bacterium]|nr:hypothetical protein [Polyangiaceae bacterium]